MRRERILLNPKPSSITFPVLQRVVILRIVHVMGGRRQRDLMQVLRRGAAEERLGADLIGCAVFKRLKVLAADQVGWAQRLIVLRCDQRFAGIVMGVDQGAQRISRDQRLIAKVNDDGIDLRIKRQRIRLEDDDKPYLTCA